MTTARQKLIRDVVPDFYLYQYDRGVDSSYIDDGGDDMYDVGNKVGL